MNNAFGMAFKGIAFVLTVAVSVNGAESKIPDFTKGEKLVQTGKDAEPVVAVIEKWTVLKGRGGAELAPKLPELRKKIEAAPKLPLKSVGK